MGERLARIRQMVRESGETPEVKLQLLERLAGRYMELGALDDMLAMLGEMRELAIAVKDPEEHALIACGYANAYTVLGRHDDAERELAAAGALLARVPARLLILKGRSFLLGRGEAEQAREALRQASEIDGAPPDVHFWLGESLAAANSPEARAAYQRYLELAPDGEYASRARRATQRR